MQADSPDNHDDLAGAGTGLATGTLPDIDVPDDDGMPRQVLVIPDGLATPPAMEPGEAAFFAAMFKGLWNSLKHFLIGKRYTIPYPFKKDDQHVRDNRFRGQHRLKTSTVTLPDGTSEVRENCVACMLCSTACPSECITIEAEPAPAHWWKDARPGESGREKRPKVFTIDLLKCIYCGMCEEACPCNAIELTNKPYAIASHRADFIYDKQRLLDN